MQVNAECDDSDVSGALFRDEEGNTGEEEEDGHERETPEEEDAATVRVDREQGRSGRDPAVTRRVLANGGSRCEAGGRKSHLSAPKPRVAPSAEISSKPASRKMVEL